MSLVVFDLVMPQMEGKQCHEELVKIHPHVKLIVSTGHSLDARKRLQLGALVKGFVNKPYEVRQLAQTVREVLDAWRQFAFKKCDFKLKLTPTLTWFPGQWHPKTHHLTGRGYHGPAMRVRDSSFQCSTLDRIRMSACPLTGYDRTHSQDVKGS